MFIADAIAVSRRVCVLLGGSGRSLPPSPLARTLPALLRTMSPALVACAMSGDRPAPCR